jgi:glycosyltransferase involved in cell wall biosynthesis
VKAFIIGYNRLNYIKYTVEWCLSHGLETIVVDNCSTYTPLLEYYATKPCEVIRLPKNYGHNVMWSKVVELPKERFIVTDPDLDFTGIPGDFLDVLNTGLDRYPSYPKCGFSIEIKDLPQHPDLEYILQVWERGYWTRPLDSMYFHADIDTTFALYREGSRSQTYSGIRTNYPYVMRHLPWYITKPEEIPQDEQYYYHTAKESATWKKHFSGGIK